MKCTSEWSTIVWNELQDIFKDYECKQCNQIKYKNKLV